MGTRSLTIVKDEDNKTILTLYRQMDGYPSGHGNELAEFLTPIKLISGIGRETTNVANGMSCLATQIVAHFKKAVGGFYIVGPGDHGQDYIYTVSTNEWKGILIGVKSGKKVLLVPRPVALFDGKRIEAGQET